MFPKKGKIFPENSKDGRNELTYSTAIGRALRAELGASHRSVKTIMGWTTANERTVKNWLAGTSGPRGEHLIDIVRHSDAAFSIFLRLSGREQAKIAVGLADARCRLAVTISELDQLLGNSPPE